MLLNEVKSLQQKDAGGALSASVKASFFFFQLISLVTPAAVLIIFIINGPVLVRSQF